MEEAEKIDCVADLDLDLFLSRNRIERRQWDASNMSWDELKAIGEDHESQRSQLERSAQLLANTIQNFEKVHSVRWRVKNPEHLMKKVIRKRTEANPQEKYLNIDKDNYYSAITDLVGIRALHLFKEDCFTIDEPLKQAWAVSEGPIAYLRIGDPDELHDQLRAANFQVKTHPAGYRSIHYVVSSQPLKRQLLAEVQVRTIFEEGWSEIDHTVRYPDYSDNKLLAYFLSIFNRLAGSADEMGSFVQNLTRQITEHDKAKREWDIDRQQSSARIDQLLADLEHAQDGKQSLSAKLSALREELSKMKASSRASDPLVINTDNLGLGPLTTYYDSFREFERLKATSGIGLLDSLEATKRRKRDKS